MADPHGQRIFSAVNAFDVEGLRRELAAGVDPDMHEYDSEATPLYYAVCWGQANPGPRLQERLGCISLLLEAGASVDKIVRGATPLHRCAGNEFAAYHAVIAMLLEAGADPNFTYTPQGVTSTQYHRSVLARAAEHGTAATVRLLISAGAVDLDRALVVAITYGKQRNCAPLLRAGAAIPVTITVTPSPTDVYIEKITAAGGYKAYEKAHRQRLVAMFLAKFPTLPVEMLERVVGFTWDIGGH